MRCGPLRNRRRDHRAVGAMRSKICGETAPPTPSPSAPRATARALFQLLPSRVHRGVRPSSQSQSRPTARCRPRRGCRSNGRRSGQGSNLSPTGLPTLRLRSRHRLHVRAVHQPPMNNVVRRGVNWHPPIVNLLGPLSNPGRRQASDFFCGVVVSPGTWCSLWRR